MALREIDIFTGLYTPGFLIAFGARELAFAMEDGYPLSLITISLDEVSGSKGSIGPVPSAEILKKLGDHIRQLAGEGSIVARTGNNEVTVLLPGIGAEKASGIATRIRGSIVHASEPGTKPAFRNVFIGIASTSDGITEFSELIRASRLALGRTDDPVQFA